MMYGRESKVKIGYEMPGTERFEMRLNHAQMVPHYLPL